MTARNFVGSYFTKERLTTVQYPEERLPQKEAARNFPFLVYDGKDPHEGRGFMEGSPAEDETGLCKFSETSFSFLG